MPWGEFTSVLNHLRGKGSTGAWDPAAEIQKLWADSPVNTVHSLAEKVKLEPFCGGVKQDERKVELFT